METAASSRAWVRLLDVFPMGSPVLTALTCSMTGPRMPSPGVRTHETQLSKDKLNELRLLPAREFPLERRWHPRFRHALPLPLSKAILRQSVVYRDVSNGIALGGIEYYLPLFFERCADFLSIICPDVSVIAGVEDTTGALRQAWTADGERYEATRH